MSDFAIETPPVVVLPVAGTDVGFPGRRCLGRARDRWSEAMAPRA